jgi:hypothetical protein
MLTLVETAAFMDLELADRARLENAVRRIPGGNARREPFVSRTQCLELFEDDVLVLPVDQEDSQKELREWISAIVRKSPLKALCGLCFVLQCVPNHDPRAWEEDHWIQLMDRFSEIALPIRVVVWTGENSRLETFRLVEAVSSLVRELDSLNELRRLGEQVGALEERCQELFSKLSG